MHSCEDLPIKILSARLAVVLNGSLPAIMPPTPERPRTPPSGSSAHLLITYQNPRSPTLSTASALLQTRRTWSLLAMEKTTRYPLTPPTQVPGLSPTPTSLDKDVMNILLEAVANMALEWSIPEQPVKKWMDGSQCRLPVGCPAETSSFLP